MENSQKNILHENAKKVYYDTIFKIVMGDFSIEEETKAMFQMNRVIIELIDGGYIITNPQEDIFTIHYAGGEIITTQSKSNSFGLFEQLCSVVGELQKTEDNFYKLVLDSKKINNLK